MLGSRAHRLGCAAIIVALSGCGDDDERPVPPVLVGPVTLTIASPVTVVGRDVYFHAADGTLVAVIATDGDGVATAVMEAGGFVTAVNPFGGQVLINPQIPVGQPGRYGDDVYTFGGVKPGDHLRLPGHRDSHHGIDPDLVMTLTLPLEPLLAGVDVPVYQITTSCGGIHTAYPALPGFPTVTLPLQNVSYGLGTRLLFGDCNDLMDVAIRTFDHSDGTTNSSPLVSYVFAPDIPIVPGGTIDLSSRSYSTTYAATPVLLKGFGAGELFGWSCSISRNGEVGLSTSDGRTARGDDLEQIMIDCPLAPPDSTLLIGISISGSTILSWGPANSAITVDHDDGVGPPDVTFMETIIRRTETLGWRWTLGLDGTATAPPLLPSGIDQHNVAPTDSVEKIETLSSKVPGGYDAVREDVLATKGYWTINPSTGSIGHATIVD